jgi:hypothetical protein
MSVVFIGSLNNRFGSAINENNDQNHKECTGSSEKRCGVLNAYIC